MAGIYIHIPFCIKKCLYCDFVSFPCTDKIDRYINALKKEILLTAEMQLFPGVIDTVFLGGGTPSLLSGEQIEDILSSLRSSFRLSPSAEISMECNPGTASKENLQQYFRAGVNRLSIGLQSADDTILKRIGRIHTFTEFEHTAANADSAGFTNINVDIMHGLPGQSQRDYLDTLRILISFPVTHISSYALILEEKTPLFSLIRKGMLTLPSDEATADMEDAGICFLRENGFQRYEISNFCKPGYECRHNMNYWENGLYLGLGAAAHGCILRNGNRIRTQNVNDPDRYMELVDRNILPWEQEILISHSEEMFETIMLGLRTFKGIDYSLFQKRFGCALQNVYPDALQTLKNRGWLSARTDSLALNEKGMDMNNAAILLFMD